MPTIDLKLKVTVNGADSWQVCLQTLSDANIVRNWNGAQPYYVKEIPAYDPGGNTLTVFVACAGYGSSTDCEVFINGTSKGTITANFDDERAASKIFDL